jgi:hypothetical protein
MEATDGSNTKQSAEAQKTNLTTGKQITKMTVNSKGVDGKAVSVPAMK